MATRRELKSIQKPTKTNSKPPIKKTKKERKENQEKLIPNTIKW